MSQFIILNIISQLPVIIGMHLIFWTFYVQFSLYIHSFVFILLIISVCIIWFYKCLLQSPVLPIFPFLLSPVPKLMVYLSCWLTPCATPTAFIPCQCSSSSVTPTHLSPWDASPVKYSVKSLLFPGDVSRCSLPSRSSADRLLGLSRLPQSFMLLCCSAKLSPCCRPHVFLPMFSSSSSVGKSAGEVNSLSSCRSKNAFVLLSHVIYTMDGTEVEFF